MDASACNRRFTQTKQQGMSLLEVMVAFVIMGLVVGAILQLFANGMRSVAISEEYSYAVQLAESQLATVGTQIPVESGTQSGSFDNGKYNWSVAIEPTEFAFASEISSQTLTPYRVLVTIRWKGGLNERQFQLSSLRFGEAL